VVRWLMVCRVARSGRVLLVALLAASCSDPDATAPSDAGAPDAATRALDISWLAEGAPALLPPVLTPCAEGWREVADEDLVICEPWPEGGPAACSVGDAQFPGQDACTPVGAPCPAGDWPEGLPTDRPITYVRAGAIGGTGTMDQPFGSISEAISAATPGSVVALAKGTYDAVVRVREGVTVWGACARETILTSSVSGGDGVVNVTSVEAELRDVSIRDSACPGVTVAGATGHLTLRGVVVSSTLGFGVHVTYGAALEAFDLAIADTRTQIGATAGVRVEQGAHAEVQRGAIVRASTIGVSVRDPGSSARLEGVAVRETLPRAVDPLGLGVDVYLGAELTLARSVVESNTQAGVRVNDPGSVVNVEDCVIRDTASRAEDGTDGQGLLVELNATANVQRTLLADNRTVGMHVRGQETDLDALLHAEDVVVRDSQPDAMGRWGTGVEAWGTARLELIRAVVERNDNIGVAVDMGATAVIEDVWIRDTDHERVSGRFGQGALLSGGAVQGTRIVIERSTSMGVLASGPQSEVTLQDLVIRDTRVDAAGAWGRGLHIQLGARLELRRALIERNVEAEISAGFAGTTLSASDVVLRATHPSACATCPSSIAGHGIVIMAEAAATLSGFSISESPLCGVLLADRAQVDLHHGEVSTSAVGACVQVDGFAAERLADDVIYRDNGTNLQSTSLPVPESTVPL